MGCNQSSGASKGTKVEQPRRRLSVGGVDNTEVSTTQEASLEEDRGLISKLNQESVLELLNQPEGGRKMSLGSATDQGKTSFANKSIVELGDACNPASSGLGYTCRKGLKPEAPNQDSWSIIQLDELSLYSVFDGHGKTGHDVSQFVKESLMKLILRDPRFRTDQMNDMLKETFKKMQNLVSTADRMKKLSAQMSGTTATVVIHETTKGALGKLTYAHVADSTAVLGQTVNGEHKGEMLTRDHKPDLKDERQRIEKAGGRVVFDGYANHRVYAKNGRYPGLNMSRCIGDLMGHQDCGITAEPEVGSKELTPEHTHLLVCSDGVWEFLDATTAVHIVAEFDASKPQAAADRLAKVAWDCWIREEGGAVVDDITVIVVYLEKQRS